MEPPDEVVIRVIALHWHDTCDLPITMIDGAKSFFSGHGFAGVYHINVSHGSVSFIKIIATVTASVFLGYSGFAFILVYYSAILAEKVTNHLLRDVVHYRRRITLWSGNLDYYRRWFTLWPMSYTRPYDDGHKNHSSSSQAN